MAQGRNVFLLCKDMLQINKTDKHLNRKIGKDLNR